MGNTTATDIASFGRRLFASAFITSLSYGNIDHESSVAYPDLVRSRLGVVPGTRTDHPTHPVVRLAAGVPHLYQVRVLRYAVL